MKPRICAVSSYSNIVVQYYERRKLVTKAARIKICYRFRKIPRNKKYVNTYSSREACRQDMGVAAGRKNKMGAKSYIGL